MYSIHTKKSIPRRKYISTKYQTLREVKVKFYLGKNKKKILFCRLKLLVNCPDNFSLAINLEFIIGSSIISEIKVLEKVLFLFHAYE
jgi:hypothetical protein